MSKVLSLGSILCTAFTLAPLTAHADTPQAFNTVCLWNDTDEDITYELKWQGVQNVQASLTHHLWKSHALILQNENSHLVPVYVRYRAKAGSDEFTPWFQLTPQRTTTKTCTALRSVKLHYAFSGDAAIEPGVRLAGPSLRQQPARP